MRAPVLSCLIPALLLAAPVQAHTGHLGELAGHDHWVAGAALGAAVLIGLWGAYKGKRKPEETDEAEPEAESDDQEQSA